MNKNLLFLFPTLLLFIYLSYIFSIGTLLLKINTLIISVIYGISIGLNRIFFKLFSNTYFSLYALYSLVFLVRELVNVCVFIANSLVRISHTLNTLLFQNTVIFQHCRVIDLRIQKIEDLNRLLVELNIDSEDEDF